VFEDGAPPRFRFHVETGPALTAQTTSVKTVRSDGAFTATMRIGQHNYLVVFEEYENAHESGYLKWSISGYCRRFVMHFRW
jgi:hypothetical protein